MILKAICTGLVSETAGSDASLLHISVACKIRIVITPWTRSCLCSSWLISTEIPLYFRGTKAGGSSADGHTTPPLPHPQQPLPQQAPTQIATHAHAHTHTHTRLHTHAHESTHIRTLHTDLDLGMAHSHTEQELRFRRHTSVSPIGGAHEIEVCCRLQCSDHWL